MEYSIDEVSLICIMFILIFWCCGCLYVIKYDVNST